MKSPQHLTAKLLLEFLAADARSGRMHSGTASSRRSAVRDVAEVVFGDGWESHPFEVADVPRMLELFATARRDQFSPGTVSSYQSNFRRTVDIYAKAPNQRLGDAGGPVLDEGVVYRFPVRAGFTTEVRLPEDLTAQEATRLASLITSLPLE